VDQELTFEHNSLLHVPLDFYLAHAMTKMLPRQHFLRLRADNTVNLKEEDLKPDPEFPFTLLCQMCWSKNAMEESDAPDQILLGSMDRRCCILLALGIFLEAWCEAALGRGNGCLFGETGVAKCAQGTICKILKEVWGKSEFACLTLGPLGTHSARNSFATRARRCGCSKDNVNFCGRWRKPMTQLCCISVNLPHPNAKDAAALCAGGPCMCQLLKPPRSGATTAWLCQHVVLNVLRSHNLQESVVMVLALPPLWAVLDGEMEACTPAHQIHVARGNIKLLEGGANPANKASLVVTGQESQVCIDPLNDDSDKW
jgi:hypothetical protein